MSLRPDNHQDYLASKRRQDKRRREAVKKYRDRVKDEVLSGEREWSSMERKPKSREKWKAQYGSEARVQFFQRQRCLVCGATPCENAHTEGGGMGMKGPPESIVPLCAGPEGHHAELHRIGRETFEARYKVDLQMYAEYWAGRWAKHTEDG